MLGLALAAVVLIVAGTLATSDDCGRRTRIAGAAAVETNAGAVTGGEDFAFMLEERPGAFIFIGQGVATDGIAHGLHTPKYDFNDEIIPIGVSWWVKLVEQELRL